MRPGKSVILVILTEPSVRRLVSASLVAANHEVFTVSDGTDALQVLKEAHPDLVILELDTPAYNGFELCRRIRSMSGVPIIVLSSRTDANDGNKALDLGADAYLAKSIEADLLLARIRAILRRTGSGPVEGNDRYEFIDLSIDVAARNVMRQGKKVKLTPTEFALLVLFVRNTGKVLTYRYVLEAIWGPDYTEEREYLRAYVYNLRQKIEANARSPQFISNVPGVGYQFDAGIRVSECPTCHRPFNQSTNGSSQGTRLVAVNP